MEIKLKGIHKYYGNIHACNNINLTLKQNEIIGILGENGAGKSTLMRILSGFSEKDAGEIMLNGRPINIDSPKAAIQHGIGLLPQDPIDISAFTILESFMYSTHTNFLLNPCNARKLMKDIAQRMGFKLDPYCLIRHLNLSQRQQIEIIRLLALEIRILILDEPTTGLSIKQRRILINYLKNLAKNEGKTILLVSHKLEDIISLCDCVHVLRNGKLIDSFNSPYSQSELIKSMFGDEKKSSPKISFNISHLRNVLCLNNVKLCSDYLAIHNLSLRFRDSEVVGLLGIENRGQRVLMRSLVGLHKIMQGQIYIGNKNMTNKDYHAFVKEGVIYCASGRTEEGLISGLTLTEHMALSQKCKIFINRKSVSQRLNAQIQHYNIHGNPDDKIEYLSGGNQQRFMFALIPPNITALVIENPTRGLDIESAHFVWKQLLIRRAQGTCIVYSSVDIEELVSYSDRILVVGADSILEIRNIQHIKLVELYRIIGGFVEDGNHKHPA